MTAQQIAGAVRDPLWLISVPMDVRLEKAKRTAQRYNVPWEDVQQILDSPPKNS